jgi:hypothetical protein
VFSERDRYIEWKTPKAETDNTRDSGCNAASDNGMGGKPFIRVTKNIIQLQKQDTILYK